MTIFDEQIARKPDKYPWAKDFIYAMLENPWNDKEFTFSSDLHDFKTRMSLNEKEMLIKTLSAIGQIEIAVKTFWAKLGEHLPHPSIMDLGCVMAQVECYSDDTEILTPYGWRLIKDINIGDKVYQYNKDFSLEETIVKNTIAKKYTGPMYEFGDNSNNCLVTPKHEMIIQRKKTNGWKLEKVNAEDVKFHSAIKMPKTIIYNGGTINRLSDYDKIAIAIQTDGTVGYNYSRSGEKSLRGNQGGYTHQVRFKKERKISRFRDLLISSGVQYKEYLMGDGETYLFNVAMHRGFTYKDFSWVNLSDKTANWCNEFIEELFHWDGSIKQRTYYSKHKDNIDFCQHVGILAGLNTTVGFTEDIRENCSTKYRVMFSQKPKLWRHIIDLSRKVIDYDAYVYCVEVTSGMILTRRKGRTFIAGNCVHNLAYERLLSVLDMNNIFEENMKLDCISGRVKYLKKYNHKFYKDTKKQYVYALILFTLFVENVSLFSQFYIILWLNKNKNILKDTSQQVKYTSTEELAHSTIGIKLVNTIREELPELFDQELEDKVAHEAQEALNAESKIVDWMLGEFEEDTLNKNLLKEFIKDRINKSLIDIKFKPLFEVNKDIVLKTNWFNEIVLGDNMVDFFNSRPTDYSRSNQSFDPENLF